MKMFRFMAVMFLVLGLTLGIGIAGQEEDDNTFDIRVSINDKVDFSWNTMTGGVNPRYYEATITRVYGTAYTQTYTTFVTSLDDVVIPTEGLYKVEIEGWHETSLVGVEMGYYYFNYTEETDGTTINETSLANKISDKIDKEIDKKIYKFRALWNENWWSGIAVTNGSNSIQNIEMTVVVDETKQEYVTTFSVQPRSVIKDQWTAFLDMIGLDGDEDMTNGNYIVSMKVPVDIDVEAYILQYVDGKLTNLTKDSSIDHYTYIAASD